MNNEQYREWANEEVEQLITALLVEYYYTPDSLEILKKDLKKIVGANENSVPGVVDFYLGGKVYSTYVKSMHNKSNEELKTAVERFFKNFYKLAESMNKKDYDTARKVYNEEFAFFAENNINDLQGPEFLVQYIIPGSRVTGYSNIIQKNLEKKLNENPPSFVQFKQDYQENQAIKLLNKIEVADAKNIICINNDRIGAEKIQDLLNLAKKENGPQIEA